MNESEECKKKSVLLKMRRQLFYIAWKEAATTQTSYFSKTTQSIAATAVSAGTKLVANTTVLTYIPTGVWISNVNYDFACTLTNPT